MLLATIIKETGKYAQYAGQYGIHAQNFHFLTGDRPDPSSLWNKEQVNKNILNDLISTAMAGILFTAFSCFTPYIGVLLVAPALLFCGSALFQLGLSLEESNYDSGYSMG